MSTDLAAGVLLPGFVGTVLPGWVARRLDDGLAGVCLFGHNIVDPQQLRALTDDIVSHNPRALIALDEEGGDVTRLFYSVGSPSPGNAWLGRYDDVRTTFEVAASIAKQVRDVGCNLNFAPSADVNSNSANPVIGVRSFGADAELAARHTAAWVTGHQSAGVAVSAKHFPGHGDTQADSHLDLPVVSADLSTLLARDLPPFEAAVGAGAMTIMTSHIMLPALDEVRPATFSPPILVDLLRRRLGFEGVIVSDALDMAGASRDIGIPQAAVRALLGGCDLLCIGSDNTDDQLQEIESSLVAAVTAGELPASRLSDASHRVAELGEQLRSSRSPDGPSATSFEPRQLRLGSGLDLDLKQVASVFDVSERARGLLAEAGQNGAQWKVVQLETSPNVAVGRVPWGPRSAAAHGEVALVISQAKEHSVDADTPERISVLQGADASRRPVVLVGRDNHRHAWVREAIDELRAGRHDVLVVDMGWPDDSRRYADIATYGGSRLLGAALLELLGVHADLPTGGTR